jgi:hypothetical protein
MIITNLNAKSTDQEDFKLFFNSKDFEPPPLSRYLHCFVLYFRTNIEKLLKNGHYLLFHLQMSPIFLFTSSTDFGINFKVTKFDIKKANLI